MSAKATPVVLNLQPGVGQSLGKASAGPKSTTQGAEFQSHLSKSLLQAGLSKQPSKPVPPNLAHAQGAAATGLPVEKTGQSLPLPGEALPGLRPATLSATAGQPLLTASGKVPAQVHGQIPNSDSGNTKTPDLNNLLAAVSTGQHQANLKQEHISANAAATRPAESADETVLSEIQLQALEQPPLQQSSLQLRLALSGEAVAPDRQASAPVPTALAQRLDGQVDLSATAVAGQSRAAAPLVPLMDGASTTGQNGQSLAGMTPEAAQLINVKETPRGDFSQLLEQSRQFSGREMLTTIQNTAAPALDAAQRALMPDGARPQSETLYLHQHLNKPEWAQEFGSRLSWMSKEGMHSAQLRLNPAHLGHIEVRISIQNDQANISIMSQHAAVKDAIEASLPRLREMMLDSGVKLDNVNVSSQQGNASHEQRQQGRFWSEQHQHGQQHDPAPSDPDHYEDELLQAAMRTSQYEQMGLSAVDYFA